MIAIAIGITLALLVAITRSILPGMVFHVLFNIGGSMTDQNADQQQVMLIALLILSISYSIYLYRFAITKPKSVIISR